MVPPFAAMYDHTGLWERMQTPCGGRPCNCGLRIIEKQGFVAERKGILHSITCCVRMVIERDRKSDNMELYESEIIELKERNCFFCKYKWRNDLYWCAGQWNDCWR